MLTEKLNPRLLSGMGIDANKVKTELLKHITDLAKEIKQKANLQDGEDIYLTIGEANGDLFARVCRFDEETETLCNYETDLINISEYVRNKDANELIQKLSGK